VIINRRENPAFGALYLRPRQEAPFHQWNPEFNGGGKSTLLHKGGSSLILLVLQEPDAQKVVIYQVKRITRRPQVTGDGHTDNHRRSKILASLRSEVPLPGYIIKG